MAQQKSLSEMMKSYSDIFRESADETKAKMKAKKDSDKADADAKAKTKEKADAKAAKAKEKDVKESSSSLMRRYADMIDESEGGYKDDPDSAEKEADKKDTDAKAKKDSGKWTPPWEKKAAKKDDVKEASEAKKEGERAGKKGQAQKKDDSGEGKTGRTGKGKEEFQKGFAASKKKDNKK